MADAPDKLRIDKWLWQARFFKSRALAARAVEAGMRVDGTRVTKPGRTVGPGETLTFAQGRRIRVIRIAAIGARRGPAPEARALYDDLTPPEEPRDGSLAAPRAESGGRPTKRERRRLIKSKRDPLD